MIRDRTPVIILLAVLGAGVLGFIALCATILLVVLPRMGRRPSALDVPANSSMSAETFNRRGNELYRKRLFKRAAVEYGHMIDRAPADPSAYLLRGMAEEEMGDYKAAVKDDTTALEYATTNDTRDALYYNRGLAHRNAGEYREAVKDLTQAISLNPRNTDAYEVRAFCYTNQGDYDRAIADYTEAIRVNPHPGTIFERGQAYLLKKEYARAVQDFSASLKVRPSFAAGYRLRAQAYAGLKQADKAVADGEATLRQSGSAADQGSLGWYDYLAGRLPEAIRNSREAVRMDGGLTFARFNLGLCYAAQGDANRMAAAYREALPAAKPADIQGALHDVNDALVNQPGSTTLRQAKAMLERATAR